MSRRAPRIGLTSALLLAAAPALAQPGALQNSTLDNLVHAKGYMTAGVDTLGAIVENGKGPIDMVLVSGFGVGASWRGRLADRPRTESLFVQNAGILVMEDQGSVVDQTIADFLKRLNKS